MAAEMLTLANRALDKLEDPTLEESVAIALVL